MRQTARNFFISTCSLAVLLGAFMLTAAPSAIAADSVVEKGKAVAVDRKKGNCLACHAMDDGTLPGNIRTRTAS
jgi:sulfur-oxidizing protein SoxX